MTTKFSGQRAERFKRDRGQGATQARSRRRLRVDGSALDRRTQILEVSERLFAEYGFEGTSVRQIADEVNLLAGSLYYHFATKEEILHEILRDPMERMLQDNIATAQFPGDAEHKIVANTLIRFHRGINDGLAQSIILTDSKFFRRREDFAYIPQYKQQSFDLLEGILKEGVENNLFRPDIDTYLMIGTFARMVVSAASWFRSGDIYSTDKPDSYTFDRVVDFYLDSALRLIRLPSRFDEPVPREVCERLVLPRLISAPA